MALWTPLAKTVSSLPLASPHLLPSLRDTSESVRDRFTKFIETTTKCWIQDRHLKASEYRNKQVSIPSSPFLHCKYLLFLIKMPESARDLLDTTSSSSQPSTSKSKKRALQSRVRWHARNLINSHTNTCVVPYSCNTFTPYVVSCWEFTSHRRPARATPTLSKSHRTWKWHHHTVNQPGTCWHKLLKVSQGQHSSSWTEILRIIMLVSRAKAMLFPNTVTIRWECTLLEHFHTHNRRHLPVLSTTVWIS